MKTCTKCGIEKNESEFGNDKAQKGGLRPSCKECRSIYAKEFKKNNPETYAKQKEYVSQWQKENKDKRNSYLDVWRKNNPEKVAASRKKRSGDFNEYRKNWRVQKKMIGIDVDAAWRHANREKLKAYKAKHEAKYPHKPIEMNAKRRAAKKKAIPSWANRKYIQLFYQLAKIDTATTGIKMVVDHIVPLQSKFVCGLHCEDNLQILTVSANAKKLNVVWPGMWT